ncbi:lipopolysaccharide core heptose(II) kinase RfaY [Fusobacterium sp. PH5-44]|uniref:lipopolysaccharide core heptose(II) kinase RfaY n=1 Tax=unclassified Fusobacterium TaxID=2648384 RepID=UPI003D247983
MKKVSKIKKSNKTIYFNNKDNLKYYDKLNKKEYSILKVLKDDKRSYVVLMKIEEEKIVYKIPREKNIRKWQRFLSIFRGSQSKREFCEIEEIRRLGFNTGTPLLAVEEKDGFVITDSYFLYSYVNGSQSTYKDATEVGKVLTEIHKLGYLHGDSQLENFIISNEINKKIYLIDARFRKNIYRNFGKAYEFLYLEESCHKEDLCLCDHSTIYYKCAQILKNLLELKRKFRKK